MQQGKKTVFSVNSAREIVSACQRKIQTPDPICKTSSSISSKSSWFYIKLIPYVRPSEIQMIKLAIWTLLKVKASMLQNHQDDKEQSF